MESGISNETVIELTDIHLPVFRIGNSIRFDETLDELRLVRESALSTKDGVIGRPKYYYWDASNRWFQAVNIVKIKRAPFWLRFTGGSNLIFATYQLQLLDERPAEWRRAYKAMMSLVEYPPDKTTEARTSLRKCDTSLKLVTWLKTYIPQKSFDGL